MPDPGQSILFFAAALLLALTPGPGIFYVAARTLAGGRAEGIASSFGTGLGGMVHVVAGSVGVSALVLASAGIFTALKLFGAAYLAWIGLRTIAAARKDALAAAAGLAGAPPVGAKRAFREGVLMEALNPRRQLSSSPSCRSSWTRQWGTLPSNLRCSASSWSHSTRRQTWPWHSPQAACAPPWPRAPA